MLLKSKKVVTLGADEKLWEQNVWRRKVGQTKIAKHFLYLYLFTCYGLEYYKGK